MRKDFSDERADAAFVRVGQKVVELRAQFPDFTNEEIAYALLQCCATLDDHQKWGCFLEEALSECLAQEAT